MFDEYVQIKYQPTNTISTFQYTHLPMKEFLAGNFSQAAKINFAFKQFIAECLSKVAQKRYKHQDIDSYIKAELVKLYQEKAVLEKHIEEEKKIIKNANVDIKRAFDALEQIYGNDNVGKAIFDHRRQYKSITTWALDGAFDELEKDQSKKDIYNVLYPVYQKMKQDPNWSVLYKAEDAKLKAEIQKQELHTKLKYRKNGHSSVENKIKRYESGKEKETRLEWMMEDVEQMLCKKDHVKDDIDPRDLETIFTENIVARRILSEKTPLIEKKKAMRHFQDKRGLFDYICSQYSSKTLYGEGRQTKQRAMEKQMRELGVYLYKFMTPTDKEWLSTFDHHPIIQLAKQIEKRTERREILFKDEYDKDLLVTIIPPEKYETLAGKKKKVKGYGGRPLFPREEESKRAA